MAEPVVVEAVVQEAVVAEAAVAGHAENVEEKCRGELLGCMDPCGQYPVWVGVPPELKKKGAKNIHFCLNCRRYLRVRAARVRTVDLSTEEMQKTWLKQGGPGPWKSKQERFAVFNYAGKCTPGKAIVIWASNISESSIQAHGSPIPQEWCEEVAGKQCLILEWRSHDFQPRKTRKRKRAAEGGGRARMARARTARAAKTAREASAARATRTTRAARTTGARTARTARTARRQARGKASPRRRRSALGPGHASALGPGPGHKETRRRVNCRRSHRS